MMKGSQSEQIGLKGREMKEKVLLQEHNYVRGEKSGKWSQEEHMQYIAFMEHNRQKMKSKQKRRSNKFYEQMSAFISTRNALQCRSHHQKLEEKYVNINKIIFLYKNTFDAQSYGRTFDTIKRFYHQKHHFYKYHENTSQNSVEMQTDIQGLDLEFVVVNANVILITHRNKNSPQITRLPTQQQDLSLNQPQPIYSSPNHYHFPQFPTEAMTHPLFNQPTLFAPNLYKN